MLGDFNVHLLNDDAFATKLKTDLHLSQLITEPTCITKKSATLIDHIYCSCKSLVRLCGMANKYLSDHCLIFCELSNEQTVSQKKFTYYLRIHRVNKEQFTIDFHALPWSLLDTAGDAVVAVDIFEKLFLYKRFIWTTTSDAWMAYRQARNCCTAKTRTAKRAFFLSARNKPRLF